MSKKAIPYGRHSISRITIRPVSPGRVLFLSFLSLSVLMGHTERPNIFLGYFRQFRVPISVQLRSVLF